MNLDKDGKLSITSRWTFRVLEEFGWNMEDMASAILDLRKEIEDKDEEIGKLNEELQKASEASGEQF